MQNIQFRWVIACLAVLLLIGPIACSKMEGIGERTGKAIDEAAEEIKEGAQEVGEAIEDGVEEAAEAIDEGAEEAEKAIDNLSD